MDQRSVVFVKRGDKVIGPMTWTKIVALAKQRKLQKADQIAYQSTGPWLAAEAALSEYLKLPVAALVVSESSGQRSSNAVTLPDSREALFVTRADLSKVGSSLSGRALLVALLATGAVVAVAVMLLVKLRNSSAAEHAIAQSTQADVHVSNASAEQRLEPAGALGLNPVETPVPGPSSSETDSPSSQRTEPEPAPAETSISLEEIEELNTLLDRFNGNSEARNEPPNAATAGDADGPRRRPRPEAIYKRALQLIRGEGVAKDMSLGFKRMERAAELGHVEAMKYVSVMYHEGMGTAVDLGSSAYWMLKAAEAGDAEAMWGLSNMYWKGEGVEQNERVAVYWVQRSAQLRHQPAVEWLAEYRAVSVINLFAGMSGAADEEAAADADRSEAQRRVSREYWESRAQREAAAGDYQAAEASRRMNQ